MTTFTYRAYGLNISSELECPELVPSNGVPDVHIRYGAVPEQLSNPNARGVFYQISPNQFLLTLDEIARYLIIGGNEIIIERTLQSSDADVRVFLLGSSFGALLHQRGALPIHGSSIATPRGAVIFSGPSGHGKSTLAWELHRRGYRHLSDDISVVAFDDAGKPLVYPAYPQMSLWADVLDKRGQARDALRQVHSELQKFALSTQDGFDTTPVSLIAIYVLLTTNTNTFAITPLKGLDKLQVFARNTYRQRFLTGMGKRTEHFQLATTAGQYLRACNVVRPIAPFQIDTLADLIEKDLAA